MHAYDRVTFYAMLIRIGAFSLSPSKSSQSADEFAQILTLRIQFRANCDCPQIVSNNVARVRQVALYK
eukprot:2797472-Heterocapsa_arctica.AAC.1